MIVETIRNTLNWRRALQNNKKMITGSHQLNDEETEHLQRVLLDLYLDVYEMCNKKGIDLFLTGGAAIGAIRHKGFIPWDDDIDCGIRRKDYEAFCKAFNEELADKYIINGPGVSECPNQRFTKIYIPNTVMRELGTRKESEYNKISMDIFIIENVPDSKIWRTIKGTICNAMEFISGQVSMYENRDSEMDDIYKRSLLIPYAARLFVGKAFSFKTAGSWFNTLDKVARHKNEQSRYCSIATGRKHYFGEIAPREVYFPAAFATFCDKEVKIFNDEDTYLRLMYGDYMIMPPVEKRENHIVLDLDFGEL